MKRTRDDGEWFDGRDDPCGDCVCCRHHFCLGEDCGETCPCSAD